MKAREYLTLVKFLDARNRDELTTFVLKPTFNISANLHPFALSGGWDFNKNNEIVFPQEYAYLLDFYVINDRRDTGMGFVDNNGKLTLSTVIVEITPQKTLYEPKIPHEILGEIVRNAIHEHENTVEKRNHEKWFGW